MALLFDVSGIFGIILGCVGTAIYNIASFPAILPWRTFHIIVYTLPVGCGWMCTIKEIRRVGGVRGWIPIVSVGVTFSYWLIVVLQLSISGQTDDAHRAFLQKERSLWAHGPYGFVISALQTSQQTNRRLLLIK